MLDIAHRIPVCVHYFYARNVRPVFIVVACPRFGEERNQASRSSPLLQQQAGGEPEKRLRK